MLQVPAVKNLGFKSYYVKLKKEGVHKENNTLNLPKEESESESSEVSLDIFKIFNDNNIKYIFNIPSYLINDLKYGTTIQDNKYDKDFKISYEIRDEC